MDDLEGIILGWSYLLEYLTFRGVKCSPSHDPVWAVGPTWLATESELSGLTATRSLCPASRVVQSD